MALNFPNSPTLNQQHTENGTTWKWNGDSWTRVLTTGAAGAQGAQGNDGAAGAQGATGGAQGDVGATGAQGAAGSAGSTGAQGAAGSDGAQGATGTGATGAQGAGGAQGSQGYQGAAGGGSGGSGAQGDDGAQGSQGHQGNAGAQGDDGAQGSQGHQGDTGTGNTGAQGADGAQGSPGSGGASSHTDSQVIYSVTANGSSAYRFAGPGNDASDDNPDLYLVRGQRYTFTNNSGGSHPFQIRSSAGGSAYSTGVTNNGASSGNIVFNVQHDAPGTLFYQCTSHSGMVGKIIILGDAIISGTFSASAGSAATIDSTPIVSVNTVEYTVYIENGTNRQAQKVLAMHDGTLAYYQEYGIMHKSGLLVSMSTDISSGNLRLRATPETGVSGTTTYRITRKVNR